MKKIVVFTGAGVSADSGISTFRDSDGLWANHKIEDVCTPEALIRNRKGVIDFYNIRRKELMEKEPNEGHKAIKDLEKQFEVIIVTQNIDNLHERAGSENVLHLHGELMKLRSSRNSNAIVDIDNWKQEYDTCHKDGSLLRPFVVFFGEDVPNYSLAEDIIKDCDILIIAGTSLAVYPAAFLVNYAKSDADIFLVDPVDVPLGSLKNRVTHIKERSAIGLPRLVDSLMR